MTEKINVCINDLTALLDDPSLMPKTLREVKQSECVVEAIEKAIASLQSAISNEAVELATEIEVNHKAMDLVYE